MSKILHVDDKSEADGIAFGDEGCLPDGWECVDIIDVAERRWYMIKMVVLRDPDGQLWGFEWHEGLTEYQENEYPWDSCNDGNGIDITLRPVREMSVITYRFANV